MFPLIRRSSPLYLSHFVTFSMMAGPILLDKPALLSVAAMLLPVWMSSSVLWSEREESYGFLRTLPVTDGEVVRSKFTLAALALVVYWLILLLISIRVSEITDEVFPSLTLIHICCGCSLVIAGCCYLGIWRWGIGIMTPVILGFMFLNIVLALWVNFGRRIGDLSRAPGMSVVRYLSEAPWYLSFLFPILAVLTYYVLMQLGIRIKKTAEANVSW